MPSNQEARVIDYMERRGERIVWGPVFRRNLNEIKESQFCSMLLVLHEVFIPRGGKDKRVWMASADGIFSVTSFFLSITRDAVVTHFNWASLWSIKAPPRVIAFRWTAILGGILTMDNLQRPRVIIVNAYPMCLAVEESIDHLMIYCFIAHHLWMSIFTWFHISGPLPNSLPSLFQFWRLGGD